MYTLMQAYQITRKQMERVKKLPDAYFWVQREEGLRFGDGRKPRAGITHKPKSYHFGVFAYGDIESALLYGFPFWRLWAVNLEDAYCFYESEGVYMGSARKYLMQCNAHLYNAAEFIAKIFGSKVLSKIYVGTKTEGRMKSFYLYGDTYKQLIEQYKDFEDFDYNVWTALLDYKYDVSTPNTLQKLHILMYKVR